MPTLLHAAQALKIAAGLSQARLAVWLIARGRPALIARAFALAFGFNGIAYTLYNLQMPRERSAGSLAVEGRAVLNWLATAAMVVFALSLLRRVAGARLAVVAVVPALLMLGGTLISARAHHVSVLDFGGARGVEGLGGRGAAAVDSIRKRHSSLLLPSADQSPDRKSPGSSPGGATRS